MGETGGWVSRAAEAEREEVRSTMAQHAAPDDEKLLHAADRLFLELDRSERPE